MIIEFGFVLQNGGYAADYIPMISSVLSIQYSWSSVASVTQLFVGAARRIREWQIWWENLNITALELAATGLTARVTLTPQHGTDIAVSSNASSSTSTLA
jgi:hypothetical protein